MPFGRAEIVPLQDAATGEVPDQAALRSGSCVKTLCVQRAWPFPPAGARFNLFHRDADNTGWSALVTELNWFDLPPVGIWASIILYDEQNLPICINELDEVFVLEHHTATLSPLGVRFTICQNGIPMAPPIQDLTYTLGGSPGFMWHRYVGDATKAELYTQGWDNSPCNNIDFSSIGDGPGTVRFFAPRNNVFINLPVPSQANLTWQRGPVVGMWHFNGHDQVRATGGYTRNCGPTYNDYEMCGNTGWHGVLLTNRERWGYLQY